MHNQIADALATMASMMGGPKEDETRTIVLEQKEPAYCMTMEEDEGKKGKGEWCSKILQYLKDGTYLEFANNYD